MKKVTHTKPTSPTIIKNREELPCQYCGRIFSNEKIVLRHMCEQRRRFQQKDAPFARFGFEAFNSINAHIFGRSHLKSEEEFRKSDFYLACLRWGHFVIDINCLDVKEYLSWLIKKNVPIDQWDKDTIYDCWVQHFVFAESIWDSYERSIKKISEWSEETKQEFKDYFRKAGTARIITDIRNASVTGWVVFCCDSGKNWLNNLEPSELDLIWGWLDVSRWQIRLAKSPDDVAEIFNICKEAGL